MDAIAGWRSRSMSRPVERIDQQKVRTEAGARLQFARQPLPTAAKNRSLGDDFQTDIRTSGLRPDVKPATPTPALDDVSIPLAPPSGVRVRDEEGRVSEDESFRAFAAERIHTKSIRRFARAYRIPVEVAEDLTQRALIALWQRRENVPHDRWPAWFFTAMLRGAFVYSRAKRRARTYEPAIALEIFTQPDVPTPEVAIHLRQCDAELQRLVASLRPERRAVVELHLLGELPLKEVADHLGIPEDTAKTRWRSAQSDMAKAFRRQRAKERFLAFITAFIAILAALRAAFRDRITRRGAQRIVPVLACATLAFVAVSHHAQPLSASAVDVDDADLEVADIDMAMPSSPFEYTFAPTLTAFAEREIEIVRTPSSDRVDTSGLDVARMLLAQANAALRDDRLGVARTYLSQYKTTFPRDPDERSARQYVAILAELASR